MSLRSLASADLLVSLLVPDDWEPTDAAADLLEVSGPVPSDGSDYRTTMTLRGGEAAGPGLAWWEDFALSVGEQVVTDDPLVEVTEVERFRLSSAAAQVVLLHLTRAADGGADGGGLPPLAMVQAWVWAGSHRMLVVGGSTTAERAATEEPQLAAVVRSLRLLPHRTTGQDS